MVIEGELPSLASMSGRWKDIEPDAQADGSKRSFILLIEDNPRDVLLVEEALREYRIDCDLTVVPDGAKAMHLLRTIAANRNSRSPNLVLLDLNLPKTAGARDSRPYSSKYALSYNAGYSRGIVAS